MNLFSILLIAVGSVIEVLGALYFATNMGGDGYAMPVFIASIAAGSMLTMGASAGTFCRNDCRRNYWSMLGRV